MTLQEFYQLVTTHQKEGFSNTKIAKILSKNYDFSISEGNFRKIIGFILSLEDRPVASSSIEREREGNTEKIIIHNSDKPLTSIEDFLEAAGLDPENWEQQGKFKVGYSQVTMKLKAESGKLDHNGDPIMIEKPVTKNNYNGVAHFQKKAANLSVMDKKRVAEIEMAVQQKKLSFHSKEDHSTWIVVGCIHRPFHNKSLWDGLLTLISRINPTGVILNGDYLDLVSLSDYSKDQSFEGPDLGQEYESGLTGIIELEQALGKDAKKVFHFGNHEDRYLREIKKIRGNRYGSALVSPVEAMGLNERGWQVQWNWKQGFTTLGKNLDVFHGIYFGAQPVKAHLDKIPDRKVLFNHTHTIDYHTKGKYEGWNIGCLLDLNHKEFAYADRFRKARWVNGFGVVHIDSDGESYVNTIRCPEDHFFFDGKRYGKRKLY